MDEQEVISKFWPRGLETKSQISIAKHPLARCSSDEGRHRASDTQSSTLILAVDPGDAI